MLKLFNFQKAKALVIHYELLQEICKSNHFELMTQNGVLRSADLPLTNNLVKGFKKAMEKEIEDVCEELKNIGVDVEKEGK